MTCSCWMQLGNPGCPEHGGMTFEEVKALSKGKAEKSKCACVQRWETDGGACGRHDAEADCPTWGPVPLTPGGLVSYECRCATTEERHDVVQSTGSGPADRRRNCGCLTCWLITRPADLARRLLCAVHRRG